MAPRKPKPGRSLAEVNPVLAKEWNARRNGDLTPADVVAYSHKKVWWLCDKDHEYHATVQNRSNGSRCPYCCNQKVLEGFNDLATTHPELAERWHPNKNSGLTPAKVTARSGKKVWWQCKEGHDWESVIYSFRTPQTCPFCNGKAVWPGFNDLETLNPGLAKQWHPDRNGGLTPAGVTASSSKKVWWLCDKGHSWRAAVNGRAEGKGCGVCSNYVLHPGVNDLETLNHELAKQWHQTKNKCLTPAEVVAGSSRRVWWQCPDKSNHEWQASPVSRFRQGGGCPICASKESVPEIELYESLKSVYPAAINRDRSTLLAGPKGSRRELDIWLPDKRVGIEFNGEYYHDETRPDMGTDIRARHEWKLDACHELGIPLIVVWEDDWNTDPEQVVDDMLRLLMQLECDVCRHAITGMGPHLPYGTKYGHSCKIIGGVPHIPHLYTYEARRCGGHRKGYFHYCDDYNRYGEDREYDTSLMGCHRQMDRGLELEDEWPVLAYRHPKRAMRRSKSK